MTRKFIGHRAYKEGTIGYDIASELEQEKKKDYYRYFKCSNCGRKHRNPNTQIIPTNCIFCKKTAEQMTGKWIQSEISKGEFYENFN